MEKGILNANRVHLEDHEYNTVKLLLNLGHNIDLIPQSQIKGVRRPDIVFNGISWEMKSPKGSGRNTIKHTMQNAGHQSPNIIVDLRRCKLPLNEAVKELKYYFNISKRIRRLMIITDSENIIDYSK